MFQGKKIVDVYSICVPGTLLHPPLLQPPPSQSRSPSTSTTTSVREQGLICCFISHLACLILHQAGPPRLIRPPRGPGEMLCKCFCRMWEVRSTLERTSSPSRALWFSLKGQTVFSKWGLGRTSLSNPLRNISNRATKSFSKKNKKNKPKTDVS